MSSVAFVLIAVLTLAAALAAATLQKLMHATLSFALTFVGVAALFFLLGAEFVGLALIFVYIGAVAVLVVFTILLTRRDVGKDRGANWGGAFLAVAMFGGLTWAILKTQSVAIAAPHIRAESSSRHLYSNRDRDDARRGKSQFYRVLALQSAIAATDWYYDRDFLNRYCCC